MVGWEEVRGGGVGRRWGEEECTLMGRTESFWMSFAFIRA